ncbi:carbohydrate kinase [Aquincola sp. S2]|uniref:Carbohydrate kinase n=1 Tax=Pseudaquabacterium terrae TaxID=2732868 RepID=A0ABX2EBF6_9BURK|nr:carbohydrate kinase [Aquabacterium terrae]NRF66233.1 carbohydrate kinase [Aquabacterium terrae]
MFIVCGEALFDVFATGDTPTGIGFDGRIGGSPFNVALGLARLGQPVGFLGGIGSGFAGERLLRAFADEGINTGCVARIDAPTTLSLVGLDAHGVPSYAFYGHGAADRLLRPEHLAAVPAQARAFHFGSYAMVVEPTGSTQRLLVEREHRRSLISFDPNIRSNVEPDLAVWRATLQWMLPRTHLLKLSDEDLALLYPGRAAEDFAREALAAGVALVVVTRGGDGAVGFTARDTVAAAPAPVALVDTVGAGDTFQAALLTWLAEHDRATPAGLAGLGDAELDAALRFAVQAAAITCSRRGADLPRRGELPPR